MCDDSRAEKRYWMRRVGELQKQMEQEDLERQRKRAAPSGPAPESVEPEPLPVPGAQWKLGSIAAAALVAISILLFSTLSAAATFV